MRHRTASVWIATLLVLAIALPAAPLAAQDNTPETPPPPDEGTPTTRAIALPFTETFDHSAQMWQANGAWVYGRDIGFSGGGWFFDVSKPHADTNTLEYTVPIDLYGNLGAQLTLRQQANLTGGDLIAIDISLDGGATWIMVDYQPGFVGAWEQHTVDLTAYRGQIIQLRFRVNKEKLSAAQTPSPAPTLPPTQDTPLDAASATATASADATQQFVLASPPGYWIDNISIQYFLEVEPPSFVFEEIPRGPHTEMGLHLAVSASTDAVVALAKRMHDIGWPLGTIKGTTGTESLLNRIAEVSPETVIVYRSLETPWGMIDCPNVHNDPVAEAQIWMYGIQRFWTVDADYYEIINECNPPTEWMVPFTIEAMRIATTMGECILAFSFAPGNPDPAYYAQLVPVYEYALENPCQPGRYHGIALHAYGLDPTTLVSESGPYLGLRHRLYYQQLLALNPEFARLPVYLTEAGPGDGRVDFDCADVTRDVIQYTSQLEHDPYVRGFHLWNVGRISGWMDVTNCLPMIGDALTNYYAGR